MSFDGPLKPGDAIGVNFVTGDLLLGGTGTVTHIDGDRIYAFGHPMYNLGPTEFPMTRAYVYTVLPSLFSSTKLSTTGETIGTLLQDRATAIAGRLGPAPKMIPVTLALSSDRGPSRTFKFEVVRDQMFTPLMTYSALLNTMTSYERQFGTATYTLKGKAELKGHDAVRFENIFTGESPSTPASSYVVGPLTALISNDKEPVEVERLDLTIRSIEEPRLARLERVWIDDPRPKPGHTVPLKVLLRTYRGEDILRTIPIAIPSNATGSLSVVVSDGQRLQQAELREARLPQPRNYRSDRARDQPGSPQQYALREAAERECRRRGKRRADVLSAALSVGRVRVGSHGRNLQSPAQRHARGMGAADRSCRQRCPHADDSAVRQLT